MFIMAFSVIDLYAKVLPKTNCKECGFSTCLAFASMVVSERYPLKNCPYIAPDILRDVERELESQYREGKWLKKDMAAEALVLAKQRVTSMKLNDIAERTGGEFTVCNGTEQIILPYFNTTLIITKDGIQERSGRKLTKNENTFIYIYMAHGGTASPSGRMQSFKEFPNTVSKTVSMKRHVEIPLAKAFSSRLDELEKACKKVGGKDVKAQYDSPDLAFQFMVFPKIPVVLLFWDENDEFEAEVKLLFDETIIQHLDIESIMFLSEHICEMLIRDTE